MRMCLQIEAVDMLRTLLEEKLLDPSVKDSNGITLMGITCCSTIRRCDFPRIYPFVVFSCHSCRLHGSAGSPSRVAGGRRGLTSETRCTVVRLCICNARRHLPRRHWHE